MECSACRVTLMYDSHIHIWPCDWSLQKGGSDPLYTVVDYIEESKDNMLCRLKHAVKKHC